MTNSAFSANPIATSARRLCCLAAVVGLLASCGGSDTDGASSATLDPSITTTSAPPDSPVFVPTPTTTVSASVTAAEAQSTTTVASTTAPTTTAPKTAAPTTAAPATSVPTSSETMPKSIRGVWRQSDAASVTAAECDEVSSADNIGMVLSIVASGFSNFEDGGRLIEVFSSDASSIDARYDTTYADTPTEDRLVFTLQDGGAALTVSDANRPGVVRYVRCP